MSDIVYLNIPEPVPVRNLVSGKPLKKIHDDWKPDPAKPKAEPRMVDDELWSIHRWLVQFVLSRPEWCKPLANQLLAQKVLVATEDQETDSRVGIPVAAQRKLRETFESDDFEVPWPYGPQLAHFGDLIIDATDKKLIEVPEPVAVAPEG